MGVKDKNYESGGLNLSSFYHHEERRTSLKKFVLVVIFLSIIVACLWPFFQMRRAYYEAIDGLSPKPYTVLQMDENMKALLQNACTNWNKLRLGSASYSVAFKFNSMASFASNFVALINYRPKSFFVTKKDMAVGFAQALFTPRSIDQSIYLSDDGNIAFIRKRTNGIVVFTLEGDDLVETLYYEKAKGKGADEKGFTH